MQYLEGCNTKFQLSPITKANRDWVTSRRMGESSWIRLSAWKRAHFQKWYRAKITQRSGIRRLTRAQDDIEDYGLDLRKRAYWIGFQYYSDSNAKSMKLQSTCIQNGGIGGSSTRTRAHSWKLYGCRAEGRQDRSRKDRELKSWMPWIWIQWKEEDRIIIIDFLSLCVEWNYSVA